MSLVDDLRYLINLSHTLAWEGAIATGTPNAHPDEPGLVAAFLDPKIQAGIGSAIGGHYQGPVNFDIRTIFTHKTPTVQPLTSALTPIPGKTPVEIADLMLVRQHFVTGAGHNHRRYVQGKALLLQAKKNKAPDSGDVSSGNPLTQMELYRDWPPFMGKGRLSPGPWDFKQGVGRRDFGEYLAVFEGLAHIVNGAANTLSITPAFKASNYPSPAPHQTAWASGAVPPTALATDLICCGDDFSQGLAGILTGTAGVPFTPGSQSGTYDWSDFVNRMIQVAARTDYTFVSRRTGIHRPTSRASSTQALMAIQPLLRSAIDEQMSSYKPKPDATGFPNFELEPHFHHRAGQRSRFIRDLQGMDLQLRREILKSGVPPRFPDEGDLGPEDGDGHVPVMLISSSGPEPLWEDEERPRPREARPGFGG